MEKERGYKVVAIVALLVAVIGVGIGFAAFRATFTIEEAPVTVNPNEKLLEDNMRYVKTDKYDPLNIVTNLGTFTNNTLSGITFSFNETFNDKAIVVAEIKNESNYDVYLTRMYTVGAGHTPNKMTECVAEEGTSQELVDKFCQRGYYFDVNIGYSNVDYLEILRLESLGDKASESDIQNLVNQSGLQADQIIYNGVGFVTTEVVDYTASEEILIPANKSAYIFVEVISDIRNVFPDGPFKIYIPEIKVEFSTANPSQTN